LKDSKCLVSIIHEKEKIMTLNVQKSTHGKYQESSKVTNKQSNNRRGSAPASRSEWAEVLSTADKYY
jgi:hypothetical protein